MRPVIMLAFLASLAALCSCSGGGGATGGTNGSSGGGSTSGGSGGGAAFSIVTLDATPDAGTLLNDLAIAVGPNDTVGVAYLQDAHFTDGGFETYDVRYVSWSNGQASQPVEIALAQNLYGISVAFDSSGNPNVAYLGGQPYGGSGSNASNSWLQSAAVVATASGGSFTTQIVDDGTNNPNGPTYMGTPANCVSPCNVGPGPNGANACVCTSPYQDNLAAVVGLYSAIGFDSKGTMYDYFRNVGFGEFDTSPVGNASASRIDGRYGTASPYTLEWAYLGDTWEYLNQSVKGLGGHLKLVMANDQPALITDEFGASGGAQSGGQNADFLMRLGANNWSLPVRALTLGDSQTGPSLAWHAGYGFAAVGYDQSSSVNRLYFTSSQDGVTWPSPDKATDVFAGAGGWFPSVAIDPVRLEPAIADFYCSDQPVAPSLQSCPASQRSVEVRELQGSGWGQPQTVDPAGGYLPKIAYLSTGKRVIAYFQLYGKGAVGPLVLAVEQ